MVAKYTLFVGTYTRLGSLGIYTCELDAKTGAVEQIAGTGGIEDPSFLAIDPTGDHLYAVSEAANGGGEGGVHAYSIAGNGSLTFLNKRSTGGAGPCHLAVDATDSHLIVANYAGGSVCMLPISADGRLEERCHFIQHAGSSVNVERQAEAHAHSVTIDPTNSRAYVCDLGMDQVVTYKLDFDNGKLVPGTPAYTSTAAGAGPRHFDYHPNGELVFVLNELGCTIVSYRFDSSAGTLTEIQSVPTLPDDWTGGGNTTADVHVSSDGRFVYASNRGHDSLVIYSVDQASGEMTYVGHQSTGGKTPRNFGIAPSGKILLAANQDTDNIVVFTRDVDTGKLSPTGAEIDVPMPVCLKFFG